MSNCFRLTPRAKQDLGEIWSYSNEVWGESQADKYVTSLYQRFKWLAQQPSVGMKRSDIRNGFYSFPQGSHLAFYVQKKEGIDIIGVPHKNMDILSYFG